jgi:hypothetical protein
MNNRTDIFRPSVIKPDEFDFVAVDNCREDSFEFLCVLEQREIIRSLIKNTGARFSSHNHGGTCHICGSHAQNTAVFLHRPTNKLIRTGWDCADKLHLCEDGERNLFRTFRDKLSAERENKAGKIKAQAILESAGLSRAWELSEQKQHPNFKDHDIIVDIVRKLIRRGDISEKQIEFLHKLVNACDNFHIVQAEREAAKKVSQHLGTVGEFHQFEGTCLFQQEWETQWGWGGITVLVDDLGNKAVVFRILECQKGDRFRFEGKVKEHGNRDGENQTIFAGRFRKPANLSKAA